ncbi:MAG TPA: Holliday junction resolvase RuvX [Jiangellaceae bacterium]|nr:Holliday junction resolvase RuvX [Jiangellaceae bacterium]
MRSGVRVGIDVGTVRIGVATCDPDGVLATPLETVRRGTGDVGRLTTIIAEQQAIEVVVGLPLSLSGGDGPAAATTRSFARALARRVAPCPVRLVDERLSTVEATRGMRERGVSARQGRESVDQAAAVVILQSALDTERGSGRPPGEIVQVGR